MIPETMPWRRWRFFTEQLLLTSYGGRKTAGTPAVCSGKGDFTSSSVVARTPPWQQQQQLQLQVWGYLRSDGKRICTFCETPRVRQAVCARPCGTVAGSCVAQQRTLYCGEISGRGKERGRIVSCLLQYK